MSNKSEDEDEDEDEDEKEKDQLAGVPPRRSTLGGRLRGEF